MQLVNSLLILLITILISGCASSRVEYKEVDVPQKCKIPKVEYPLIDNSICKDQSCTVAKALKNYEMQKEYGEKLLINQKVCE